MVRPIVPILLSLIGLISTILPSVCQAQPSKTEAERLIVRHFGYPLLAPAATICGERSSDVYRGVERLIRDGYLLPNSGRLFRYEPEYVPAEKAKPYILRGPTYHVLLQDYCLQVSVCRIVFKGTTRITATEQGNAAIVTFVTGQEPVEPFYSLLCISTAPGCRLYYGDRLTDFTNHRVTLRLVGAAWRMEDSGTPVHRGQ